MNFIYPQILWGLVAIAIPIIIHLFNFRRYRKVYFSNTKFIQELKRKKKRRYRVKQLLVLLTRILVVCCLVFAFAQAFIPTSKSEIDYETGSAVSIYIDNSNSMGSLSEQGSLLDEAKKKAAEIIESYKQSDDFMLLTNDFEARDRHFITQDEIEERLLEVTQTPVVEKISDVRIKQIDLFDKTEKRNKEIYLLSDLQKSTFKLNEIVNDTSIQTYIIPLKGVETNNLYIDSCWFESPVQSVGWKIKLYVKIINSSNESYEKIPLKFFTNNEQKALSSFDISGKGTAIVSLNFTHKDAGFQYGKLFIEDYPIVYDDNFYISYYINEFISVLSINEQIPNKNLQSLYSIDETIKFSNIQKKRIDYSAMQQYNLLILNELKQLSSGLINEILRFVENGGHLFIIPNKKDADKTYTSLFQEFGMSSYKSLDTSKLDVKNIDFQHPIFADVFEKINKKMNLPQCFLHYPIQNKSFSGFNQIISLQNGDVLIGEKKYGKGKVLVSSIAYNDEFSNLMKHSVFVPLMLNVAFMSSRVQNLYYTIGEMVVLKNKNGNNNNGIVYKIKKTDSNFEFIPEIKNIGVIQSYIIHEQMIKNAGNYYLTDDINVLNGISMNYDRKESDLEYYSIKELESIINDYSLNNVSIIKPSEKSLSTLLNNKKQGMKLWRWFLLAALLFLFVEILILRFWPS